LFLCKTRLGYTDHEARHILIGEYIDQFEVYKKYHNIEVNKMVFSETDEKNEKSKSEEQFPQWYIDFQKGK